MKKITAPLTQSEGPVASKDDNDYETQGHMKTLMDAEMIKQDPEKMKKVHKLAGRHHKAIKSIKDIKDAYQEKFGSPVQGHPMNGKPSDEEV